MLRSGNLRFILGLGLAIVLLIIVFILILTHSSSPKITQSPLASYANNSSAHATLLIDGPETAPGQHSQVQLIISNSQSTINVFSGYNDQLVNTGSTEMNPTAFHIFLRSLEGANFTSGNSSRSLAQASGYCPLGDRYIFSFSVDNHQTERYWTTSCGGTKTYNGAFGLTFQLFRSQIPNYSTYLNKVNI